MGERTALVTRGLTPALLSLALLACNGDESLPHQVDPKVQDTPGSSAREQALSTIQRPKRPRSPHTSVIDTLVSFAGTQGYSQRMTAAFAGESHARLWFGTLDSESPDRRLIYQSEDRVFAIEPRSSESHELPPVDAQRTLVQLALRRAAYLWPEGFEWTAEGNACTAPIAGGLGSLRASFERAVSADFGAQLPLSFESTLANGEVLERYADLVWSDERRLQGLHLFVGEQAIWRETLDSFEPRARFVSSYFTPADRRTGSTGLGEAMVASAARVELLERTVFYAPFTALLGEGTEAPRSLAQARALAEIERAKWKTGLEQGFAIAVDALSHEPQALLFWPAAPDTDPGQSFTSRLRSKRNAVALLLTHQEAADVAQSLPQLRTQVPAGGKTAASYEIHFGEGDPELGDDRAQLIWAYDGP